MSELDDLYQQVILDHYRSPRNNEPLEAPTSVAQGHNPLCGDRVVVQLTVENDTVQDVSVQGMGCAISTASASLMTEAIKGKSTSEVTSLFERFHSLVTSDDDRDALQDDLGKLEVLAGVRAFPVRVKCATLAWHTLKSALDQTRDTVTTE